jgi:hypothetical protein
LLIPIFLGVNLPFTLLPNKSNFVAKGTLSEILLLISFIREIAVSCAVRIEVLGDCGTWGVEITSVFLAPLSVSREYYAILSILAKSYASSKFFALLTSLNVNLSISFL